MDQGADTRCLPPLPLPSGVTSRFVPCPEVGLNFHILESDRLQPSISSTEEPPQLILLLHGFPELAFSWRHVLPSLSRTLSSKTNGSNSYHIVAVDQRGYGRTTGWSTTNLDSYTMTSLARDIVVLVRTLGYTHCACVVGHDFGAVAASMCAVMRPDMFRRVVLMSHPFKGMPDVSTGKGALAGADVQKELAALSPPRKHYKWYNSSAHAAHDWESPEQGMREFLHGYIHLKSGDWYGNEKVYPLKGWSAGELARLPNYYVMPLEKSMAETVAADMADESVVAEKHATKRWLPDDALDVYVREWTRTGFQGGLNWYRAQTDGDKMQDLWLFAGKKIEVPCLFLSGARDWGNQQMPGALDGMPGKCSSGFEQSMIENVGHWPQQEDPESVVREIAKFIEQGDEDRA